MLTTIFRALFRRTRRVLAEDQLAGIDAELAHWFVADGTLAEGTEHDDLRGRRLAAVAELHAAGGCDPFPTVLRSLSPEQEAAAARRAEALRLGVAALARRDAPDDMQRVYDTRDAGIVKSMVKAKMLERGHDADVAERLAAAAMKGFHAGQRDEEARTPASAS